MASIIYDFDASRPRTPGAELTEPTAPTAFDANPGRHLDDEDDLPEPIAAVRAEHEALMSSSTEGELGRGEVGLVILADNRPAGARDDVQAGEHALGDLR
jgi:hypothetical protein